jgi:hypothetical protein
MVGNRRNLLDAELKVVNLGLDIFYSALKVQDVKVIDAKWKPSPVLEKEFREILDKIL